MTTCTKWTRAWPYRKPTRAWGLGLPEGSYLTVAGFALDRLGHIPEQGEEFYFNDLRLEITEMRNLKIETVRIHRVKETAAEPTNKR